MAAGWYKREFDAGRRAVRERGKIMDEKLDILKRFWTEDMVKGEWTNHKIPAGRHVP
jgi:alkanesulfonate monooxygenase